MDFVEQTFLAFVLALHVLLVEGFDCVELVVFLFGCEVHLGKRALSDHFGYEKFFVKGTEHALQSECGE